MRGCRGARSTRRRPASTPIVICADRRRRSSRPTPAPRAQQTCRSCAPMCRKAGDESSPASSSTKRKSRTAASRPLSARCSHREEVLLLPLVLTLVLPLVPRQRRSSQPDTGSTVSAPPSPAGQRESHSSTPAASGPSDRYFLMKQVKIIDQGMGKGMPAYDLMIPTTWQFKGWVNFGAAEGGCFADCSPWSETPKAPTTRLSYRCFPSTRGSTSMIPPGSARCSSRTSGTRRWG